MADFDTGPFYRRLKLHNDWRYDIPLKFLWSVFIYPRNQGSLIQLGNNIERVIQKYETTSRNQWPVNTKCLDEVTDEFGNFGCFLAQSIALPSDSFNVSTTNIPHAGGYLPGVFSENREPYGGGNKLDITFLETNIDIFDYFFRPWVIANSYKGLIELEDDDEDLKCNIQLVLFSRDYSTYRDVFFSDGRKRPRIRKIYEFFDVTPFNVQGDEMSYGELGPNEIQKTVSFSFSKYFVADKNSIPIDNG